MEEKSDSAKKSGGKSLSLLSLNVCGLKGKSLSVDFTEKCQKYDILCTCETRCDDVDMNNVKADMDTLGFDVIYKNRHSFSRYKAGGLMIAVNKKYKLQWKPFYLKSDVFISVILDKTVLGLDRHLIISSVYIPPCNSRYANVEHFSEIDDFLLEHSIDNAHLLCGDFNAHTGTLADYVKPSIGNVGDGADVDVGVYLPEVYVDFGEYGIDSNRYSKDLSCHRSCCGKKILDLCKNNLVCIFNGRVGEDYRIGKATTVHNTVVDYIIGTPNLFTKVVDFKVLDFDPLLSDVHSGIHVSFSSVNREYECESGRHDGKSNVVNWEKPGKWRNNKIPEYVAKIDTRRVNYLADEAESMTVEELSVKLKHVLVDPAFEVFPPNKSTRKFIKVSNNVSLPGYDTKCWKSRREYHSAKHKHNVC